MSTQQGVHIGTSKKRGRFWPALLIGALVATVAGVTTSHATKALYASLGSIHISPVLPSLLLDKGDGTLPNYDSFVATQMSFVKSERCLDTATSNPRWMEARKGVKRSNSTEAVKAFAAKLDVKRDGEFIWVKFSDSDPWAAEDAVHVVIESYMQLTQDEGQDNPRVTQAKLQEAQIRYKADLAAADAAIQSVAGGQTFDALQSRYLYKMNEANQAETEWNRAKNASASYLALHASEPKDQVKNLQVLESLAREQYESLEKETRWLGDRVEKIKSIEADTEQKREWLKLANEQMEALNLRMLSPGRIEVFSYGERPIRVAGEREPKVAIAAGLAFILVFSTVLLWPRKKQREGTVGIPN